MAWKPDYTTLALLKAHLRISDTGDDTALAAVITAASRAIDHETGRQFGQADVEVSRYYTYRCGYVIDGRAAVPIDDIDPDTDPFVQFDTDGDGTFPFDATLNTDVTLWPYNASLDGKPATHLLALPVSASQSFPSWPNSILVTGTFGWASVPDVVKTACLIQSARFFVRRDAAFGVAGSPEIGSEMRLLARLDPDVALLLSSVKRHWGAV